MLSIFIKILKTTIWLWIHSHQIILLPCQSSTTKKLIHYIFIFKNYWNTLSFYYDVVNKAWNTLILGDSLFVFTMKLTKNKILKILFGMPLFLAIRFLLSNFNKEKFLQMLEKDPYSDLLVCNIKDINIKF